MGQGGTDREDYISRIGTFFLLVGVLLLIMFVASDAGEETYFRYFVFGSLATLIGIFFKRMTAKPPKPGARFAGIRGFMQKRREAAKKREEDKKKKK